MTNKELVEVDPEKLGGTLVFTGTRVPIQNFFDYLEAGDGLDVFIDDFPTVTREQAVGVLKMSRRILLADYSQSRMTNQE